MNPSTQGCPQMTWAAGAGLAPSLLLALVRLEAVTAYMWDISILSNAAFDLSTRIVSLLVRGALSQYTGMPCSSIEVSA